MIKFDHSMVDQNQGREPMPHHAPFSIQDIQSAVEQGREAERARIIALLQEADIYGRPVVLQRDQLIALINGENE
jgi:hypothetical protein